MKSIISCGELSRGEYSNIVIQSYLLYEYPKNRSFKSDTVNDTVRDTVDDTVNDTVDDTVSEPVNNTVSDTVNDTLSKNRI